MQIRQLPARTRQRTQAVLFRLQIPIAKLLAAAPAPPRVTAKAVYCLDITSSNTLFEKNADFKLPPASTIKLATALLLVQAKSESLDTPISIESRDCVKGSSMGLRPGDIVTYGDLLHGLLLPSGNDAALAIARSLGQEMLDDEGGNGHPVDRFVRAMNELAAGTGLSRTRFANPSGFPVAGQYSTARDIAMLSARAFSEPIIRQICGTKATCIQIEGAHPRRLHISSTVAMLGEGGVLCGKTGSAPEAGACLGLFSDLSDRRVVTVLLASSVRYSSGIIQGTDRRYDDARIILSALSRSPSDSGCSRDRGSVDPTPSTD